MESARYYAPTKWSRRGVRRAKLRVSEGRLSGQSGGDPAGAASADREPHGLTPARPFTSGPKIPARPMASKRTSTEGLHSGRVVAMAVGNGAARPAVAGRY
jgi:hypothetical protein